MDQKNTTHRSFESLREDIVGLNVPVTLLDGSSRRYVFLDNAASTPTFYRVLRRLEEFLPWYAGVHRGVGLKAMVSTRAYDEAHRIAGDFVGADHQHSTVLFTKNTTESLNKIASRYRFAPDDIILTTLMEHHSNDLPWRRQCRVIRIGVLDDGSVNLAVLREQLRRYTGKVRLVAITGASNVTGIVNPIHEIARWTHEAGARIVVDAAQLVAHRPVRMLPPDDPAHIDFLAYSAHKMYAPFGVGVLIGPKEFFREGEPELVGGGTVSYVGLEEIEWASLPHKEEAGSPNVTGAIALAEAITILREVGMERIADHEQHLLSTCVDRLSKIPRVRMIGPLDRPDQKVGVVPFVIEGMDHALVATILSVEAGIGVRNGNFCAQPYTRHLLNVTQEEEKFQRSGRCDTPKLPGMARASFGCYNNEEDLDLFTDMVGRIAAGSYRGSYALDRKSGVYQVAGHSIDPDSYFHLNGTAGAKAETLPPKGTLPS
jgi:cysteine desulfurase/selenocysteine lyase